MNRPVVVCLLGSSKFKSYHEESIRQETLRGKIVLAMGLYGHVEGLDMDGPVKAMLDQLHLRKIDMADEVLVVNPGGYVGQSTANEISYARSLGKRVLWWATPTNAEFLEGEEPAFPDWRNPQSKEESPCP